MKLLRRVFDAPDVYFRVLHQLKRAMRWTEETIRVRADILTFDCHVLTPGKYKRALIEFAPDETFVIQKHDGSIKILILNGNHAGSFAVGRGASSTGQESIARGQAVSSSAFGSTARGIGGFQTGVTINGHLHL
jgi:hypothetical protein